MRGLLEACHCHDLQEALVSGGAEQWNILERQGAMPNWTVLIRHLVSTLPADLDSVSASRGHVSRLRHRALWGGPEKAIQVERALLVERDPSVDEFGALLDRLHLSTVLQGYDRYELSHTSWPQTQAV